MWLSLMPSSFSTPEDKSTPNGLISLRISWIFFILIPPDKNLIPYGIDISSGVEEKPGIKSTEKINKLLEKLNV